MNRSPNCLPTLPADDKNRSEQNYPLLFKLADVKSRTMKRYVSTCVLSYQERNHRKNLPKLQKSILPAHPLANITVRRNKKRLNYICSYHRCKFWAFRMWFGWFRCGLGCFGGGMGLSWQVNVIKMLLNVFFNYCYYHKNIFSVLRMWFGWFNCGLGGGLGLTWQVNVIKMLLNFFLNY